MSLEGLVLGLNYAVLIYFLLLNGFYLLLYALSFVEISRYARRDAYTGLSELFASNYAPPVSLIVPYNEEATIAASVRSFLALRYPLFEIVVVNDGSKDRTVEVLREKFGMSESDRPVRMQLKTQPVRTVYASPAANLAVMPGFCRFRGEQVLPLGSVEPGEETRRHEDRYRSTRTAP